MPLHCLGGKWTKHKGVVRDLQSQGVKFDNVGLPYDHPIPHIPIPPKFVLEWNKTRCAHCGSHISILVIVMYLMMFVVLLCVHESTKVENGVRTYMASYEFQIIKEWWGVNELRLACPSNPKETVMVFTTNGPMHGKVNNKSGCPSIVIQFSYIVMEVGLSLCKMSFQDHGVFQHF